MRLFLSISLLTVIHTAAAAQPLPRTPERGSAERSAILDALRPPVERALDDVPMTFGDVSMVVVDGWAYVRAIPYATASNLRDPGQGSCDCDSYLYGLLRLEDAGWSVAALAVRVAPGATPYTGWAARHHAPAALFARDPDQVALEAAMREYIDAMAAGDARRFLALLPRTTPVRVVDASTEPPESKTTTYSQWAADFQARGDLYHRFIDGRVIDPQTQDKENFEAEMFQQLGGRAMWHRYAPTVFVHPLYLVDSLAGMRYVRWKKEDGRWVIAEFGLD